MKKFIVLVCGVLMTAGTFATDTETDSSIIVIDKKTEKVVRKNTEKLKNFKGNFSTETDKAGNKVENSSEKLIKFKGDKVKGNKVKAASAEQVSAKNELLFDKMDSDADGMISKAEYMHFKAQQLTIQNAKKSQ
ncbi:hypothetical protein [Psychromonas sp. SR45-3]|uniref:hypothetical protein n=1 Tax=Psychromonas sp. SR45-3 TaxID=2760930 RepID=UPI0015FDEB91|nr:hypothetical protein [Psychromonas sp. SR45-3]MBB1271956.1 hypothetical protein [Psychromonas sp. SR45-3]